MLHPIKDTSCPEMMINNKYDRTDQAQSPCYEYDHRLPVTQYITLFHSLLKPVSDSIDRLDSFLRSQLIPQSFHRDG